MPSPLWGFTSSYSLVKLSCFLLLLLLIRQLGHPVLAAYFQFGFYSGSAIYELEELDFFWYFEAQVAEPDLVSSRSI